MILRTPALILYCVLPAVYGASVSFVDSFSRPNASLWIQTNGVMQTPPFDARPSHLHYNHSLSGNLRTSHGLLVTMDENPCKSDPHKCCVKADRQASGAGYNEECATVASGHLKGNMSVLFGRVSTVIRVPYAPDSSSVVARPPSNAFACVATYTNSPAWNEIDMCWHPNTNQLDASIWIKG